MEGAKWEEMEDEALIAVMEYYGEHLGPTRSIPELENKSPEECRKRWRFLNTIWAGIDPLDPKKLLSSMVARHPNGFGELPLLPFLEICKHLGARQVFGVLPAVCTNFYCMMQWNSIFMNQIQIYPKTPISAILMMAKRVWGCQEISIQAPAWNAEPFHEFVLGKLLSKVSSSVTHFSCTTRQQEFITNFINRSPKLVSVNIESFELLKEWDWSKHSIHLAMRKMTFKGCTINPNIDELMTKVPNLETMIWDDQWPPLYETKYGNAWSSQSKIRHFEGPFVLPINYLWPVTYLKVSIIIDPTLEKLTEVVPQLTMIQCLHVKINKSILARLECSDVDTSIRNFLEAVKINKSLQILILIDLHDSDHGTDNFDLEAVRAVQRLPLSIHTIQYKNKVIRHPSKVRAPKRSAKEM
jgi:hypothetical protein